MIFRSLYESAIFKFEMAAIYARETNGDNSILVGEGLKMQNSNNKNQTVATTKKTRKNTQRHTLTNWCCKLIVRGGVLLIVSLTKASIHCHTHGTANPVRACSHIEWFIRDPHSIRILSRSYTCVNRKRARKNDPHRFVYLLNLNKSRFISGYDIHTWHTMLI